MDASRLLALLKLLEEDSAAYTLELKQLLQLFRQVQASPAENFYPQIEEVQLRLFGALTESRVNHLVPTRRAMLVELGGQALLGLGAVDSVGELLTRGTVGGPSSVASALEEFSNRVQSFLENVGRVRAGLQALGVVPEELGPDEYEFGLILPDTLSKGEVTFTKEFLGEWEFILKTFMEVGGDRTPVVRIRGIATGSPLQFFVDIPNEWTAAAIAIAVERLTQFYKTILEISVLRHQLNERGVKTAEADAIKAQEKEKLDEGLAQLEKEIVESITAKHDGGRKSELRTALRIALQLMAHHMNRGVDQEVSFPPADAPPVPANDDPEGQQAIRDHQARVATREAAALGGAAMASLPLRSEPVLQLTKPSVPTVDHDEAKKPKR